MEASADLRVKELLGEPADACLSLRLTDLQPINAFTL